MTNSLADKVVLVVGGSTGIGLATGIAFAEEGAQVVLSARREARLAAAKTLSGGGDKLRVRIADAGN
jgi:NAD(P)-dependent dehydrogenase (short-subunit alcohol dehydrogenase family)